VLAYLDANITIYLVERIHPWYPTIAPALDEAEIVPVVSDMTRLECRVGPLRTGNTGMLVEYDSFFSRTAVLPLTAAVFDRAAALRAVRGLKTPDAIHLACALEHGCEEFWTNDRRFASAAPELRLRVFA
jgi:predicted nucleic acid-binding protein